jgi:hypothetical protein
MTLPDQIEAIAATIPCAATRHELRALIKPTCEMIARVNYQEATLDAIGAVLADHRADAATRIVDAISNVVPLRSRQSKEI